MVNSDTNNTHIDELEIDEETAKKKLYVRHSKMQTKALKAILPMANK
jgi:hypothetical protein